MMFWSDGDDAAVVAEGVGLFALLSQHRNTEKKFVENKRKLLVTK